LKSGEDCRKGVLSCFIRNAISARIKPALKQKKSAIVWIGGSRNM
jgi:hypothetical protein